MNTSHGFVSLFFILAIVIGIAALGGGGYWLKSRDSATTTATETSSSTVQSIQIKVIGTEASTNGPMPVVRYEISGYNPGVNMSISLASSATGKFIWGVEDARVGVSTLDLNTLPTRANDGSILQIPAGDYFLRLGDFHTGAVLSESAVFKVFSTSLKTYTNANYHFSLSYLSDFKLLSDNTSNGPVSYMPVCNPTGTGAIDSPCLYYVGTTTAPGFDAAAIYMEISTSTNLTGVRKPVTIEDCEGPTMTESGLAKQDTVTINGTQFIHSGYSDAGLGHYLKNESYTTYFNRTCYRISLNIASSRVDSANGETSYPAAFYKNLTSKMQAILATFQFTSAETASIVHKAALQPWNAIRGVSLPMAFEYPGTWSIGYNGDNTLEVGSISIGLARYQNFQVQVQNANELGFRTFSGFTPMVLGGEQGVYGDVATSASDPTPISRVLYISHKGKVYRIYYATPDTAQYNHFFRSFYFTD